MHVTCRTCNHISFYAGMYRLKLAALHFNENCDLEHATTQGGSQRWKIIYPKYKKGEAVAKKIKVDSTFGKSIHHKYVFNVTYPCNCLQGM